MRRLLPLFASLFAVLLFAQWSAAAAACLPRSTGPAFLLCHTAEASDVTAPDAKASDVTAPEGQPADKAPSKPHAAMACPLCAPLPPALLAGPPAAPPPPKQHGLATPRRAVAYTAPGAAHPTPLQARAPPPLA